MSVHMNAHYVPQVDTNPCLQNGEQWQQVANEGYVRNWRDNQTDDQQPRLKDDPWRPVPNQENTSRQSGRTATKAAFTNKTNTGNLQRATKSKQLRSMLSRAIITKLASARVAADADIGTCRYPLAVRKTLGR